MGAPGPSLAHVGGSAHASVRVQKNGMSSKSIGAPCRARWAVEVYVSAVARGCLRRVCAPMVPLGAGRRVAPVGLRLPSPCGHRPCRRWSRGWNARNGSCSADRPSRKGQLGSVAAIKAWVANDSPALQVNDPGVGGVGHSFGGDQRAPALSGPRLASQLPHASAQPLAKSRLSPQTHRAAETAEPCSSIRQR